MICPVCEKMGLKSKVFSNGSSVTLMGYSPYYDEDGQFHNHDPNRITMDYHCSNDHVFVIRKRHSCTCGWSGGDDETIICGERRRKNNGPGFIIVPLEATE